MLVYLFLIPLVTHSPFTRQIIRIRALTLPIPSDADRPQWQCVGTRKWAPDRLQPALYLTSDKRDWGGEGRRMRKRENCPNSLWHSSLDFEDIVVLFRKDLFIYGDSSDLNHSGSVFISDSKDENEIVLIPPQHQVIVKRRFFQQNYSMIYVFALSFIFLIGLMSGKPA